MQRKFARPLRYIRSGNILNDGCSMTGRFHAPSSDICTGARILAKELPELKVTLVYVSPIDYHAVIASEDHVAGRKVEHTR